ARLAGATLLVDQRDEDHRELFGGERLEHAAEEQLGDLQLEAVDATREPAARRQGVTVEVAELVEEREVPVQHTRHLAAVLLAILLRRAPVLELVERLLPRFLHAVAAELLDEVQDRRERQAKTTLDGFGFAREEPLQGR